jgi:hypothetical protein
LAASAAASQTGPTARGRRTVLTAGVLQAGWQWYTELKTDTPLARADTAAASSWTDTAMGPVLREQLSVSFSALPSSRHIWLCFNLWYCLHSIWLGRDRSWITNHSSMGNWITSQQRQTVDYLWAKIGIWITSKQRLETRFSLSRNDNFITF